VRRLLPLLAEGHGASAVVYGDRHFQPALHEASKWNILPPEVGRERNQAVLAFDQPADGNTHTNDPVSGDVLFRQGRAHKIVDLGQNALNVVRDIRGNTELNKPLALQTCQSNDGICQTDIEAHHETARRAQRQLDWLSAARALRVAFAFLLDQPFCNKIRDDLRNCNLAQTRLPGERGARMELRRLQPLEDQSPVDESSALRVTLRTNHIGLYSILTKPCQYSLASVRLNLGGNRKST